MELGYDAQRRYCQRLGIIPGPDEGEITGVDQIKAWYDSPQAQEVSGLLATMETHWRKMQAVARWVRDGLTENETRMAGDEVHSSGLPSAGITRYAAEYDMALSAYLALEGHLQGAVNGIRRSQGYEVSAWTRLEDHPQISPEEDQARHALARLEQHLKDQEGYTAGGQRRHLREDHQVKARPQDGPAPTMLHEQAHAAELASLRGLVASFETAKEGSAS